MTASLLLAAGWGSHSVLVGWAPGRPGLEDATFSHMLSKKGSCLHPPLGLERETSDLGDGPGETEAQGCCGFTKVTWQVLQSCPPGDFLDHMMLSGGAGGSLAL